MKTLLPICTFLILLTFTNSATAGSKRVDAPAGKTILLGTFGISEGRSCRYITPEKATLKQEPEHGTAYAKKVTTTISEGKCKGSRITLWAFYYKGNGKKDLVKFAVEGSRYAHFQTTKTWYNTFKINY